MYSPHSGIRTRHGLSADALSKFAARQPDAAETDIPCCCGIDRTSRYTEMKE